MVQREGITAYPFSFYNGGAKVERMERMEGGRKGRRKFNTNNKQTLNRLY